MMTHSLLIGVGGLAVATASYIWVGTAHWYDMVPGVRQTGPLNLHFARDVGLAYFASGVAMIWGGAKQDPSAALCGAAWPVLHALFHVWIWLHRGLALDAIAATNLAGIQLPAYLGLYGALRLRTNRRAAA
jgi:hypothetical protein